MHERVRVEAQTPTPVVSDEPEAIRIRVKPLRSVAVVSPGLSPIPVRSAVRPSIQVLRALMGPAGEIEIKRVETLPTGAPAEVINEGSQTHAELVLKLPQGEPGPSGNAIQPLFAEAVAAGQPVYLSRVNGQARQASAAQLVTARVAGLSAFDVSIGFVSAVTTQGPLVMPDWTAATGSQYLTPGALYFLDVAAGLLSTLPTEQPGTAVTIVGQAVSPTTMDVQLASPILL